MLSKIKILVGVMLLFASCTNNATFDSSGHIVPKEAKEVYALLNLVKENKITCDSMIRALDTHFHQLHAKK